jgi:hypothetical protein
VSCSGYPTSLPGWTRYNRYPDVGGENTYLQREDGVRARDLREARRLDREAAREEKHLQEVTGV